MANAAGGNFYYIQSPDDAGDVFRIEIESLISVVAQNLTVTLQPKKSVESTEMINNYRTQTNGNAVQFFLGDVYGVEKKPLAIALSISSQTQLGEQNLLNISYQYQSIVDEKIEQFTNELEIARNG